VRTKLAQPNLSRPHHLDLCIVFVRGLFGSAVADEAEPTLIARRKVPHEVWVAVAALTLVTCDSIAVPFKDGHNP
jgi:hypothetical protein